MGERRDGNMSDKAYDNGIRLNLQMIADPMDEMVWEFTMHRGREMPTLRGCLLYFGQTQLRKDMLYLIQDGMEQGFPADSCCYVTTGGLKGEAPHIRGLRRPFPEVFNQVMTICSPSSPAPVMCRVCWNWNTTKRPVRPTSLCG